MEARVLMLSSGSGCSPMTSSPLIFPRLWESRLTLLKVWRPPRPSGRCTCAGHLWRWWVVYAPNFPGSTTWLCEPPLACLFPCHSCAFHTLSRDLQVWRRGYLVPLAFRRSSMFPEGKSQVTYVTLVPRGNETLRRRAVLPASLLELCFIPGSWRRLHIMCF